MSVSEWVWGNGIEEQILSKTIVQYYARYDLSKALDKFKDY